MRRFLSRRPRTVKVPADSGSVDIQKVEVKQKSNPFFTRFLVRFALAYCVISTVYWIRSDDFNKRVETFKRRANESTAERQKRLQQLSRHPAEQRAASPRDRPVSNTNDVHPNGAVKDDIIQLTLPIWFRERKKEMFKESDPEWQSFLELQQDNKRTVEVKMKVSKAVAVQFRSPHHARQLAYIHFNQRVGASLEIIPPIYAPQTYEVPCICIGSDWRISLGWRALSRTASAKTQRMFHPVVFSQAFFAGVRAFSVTSFQITKAKLLDQYYGPEPMKIRVSMAQKGKQKIVTAVALERQLSREQQLVIKLPMSRLTDQQAKLNLPFLRGASGEDSVVKKHHRDVVSSMTYQDAIEHASGVFKQTWLDSQVAAVQESTNGVCVIGGFVDCFGERGRYRVEIMAFYMPAEDVFLGKPRITNAYIIPDLSKFQQSKAGPAPQVFQPQQGSQGATDKPPSIHQPPPPAEKPTPGKDAGK